MKPKILIIAVILIGVAVGVYFFLSQPKPVPASGPITSMPDVDFDALKTKAADGDPAAQTSLAKMYLQGSQVKVDNKEAAKWLQLAADKNYPDAQAMLGELNQGGSGVPYNLTNAVRLFQLAADGGSVSGQYDLAFLYEQGIGVKKDEVAAAKWYQLAAEGGDATAQYDIGQRYELGLGVTSNRIQAYKWLMLAANQGQTDSVKLLPDLKNKMTADELTDGDKQVKAFIPRSSQK